MDQTSTNDIRQALLEVIEEVRPKNATDGALQQNSVLPRVAQRLSVGHNVNLQRLVLSEWYSLFTTGHLSWGHNIDNPGPPFCHVTARGDEALAMLSRDPSNPRGYLEYVRSVAELSPVAWSYLDEALKCYVGGQYKAASVMLGGSLESVVLEIRDHLVERFQRLKVPVPSGLHDWRVKTVLDEVQRQVDARRSVLPRPLLEEASAHWPAFAQQIRAIRNEAGHPSSVDPVTPESAHAAFLMFPILARISQALHVWIDETSDRQQ